MSQFDDLLAQLHAVEEEQSTMAKALPQEGGEDDNAIQTAAAEGAEGENNPEDEDDTNKPLAKSMTIDGEDVEVVDAEELVKSLHDLTGRLDETESVLAKGLGAAIGMLKTQGELLKGQGDLIKSMQGQIAKMAGQGAGRKTVLNVHERQPAGETLVKSQQDDGITKEQFLAKSEAAWNAGVISGVEFSSVDVALRTGNKLDTGLINRIVNHK